MAFLHRSSLYVSPPFQLWLVLAGWLFVAGFVLFSGSLYALALTGNRRWAAVMPFGGLTLLLGWLALFLAILTVQSRVSGNISEPLAHAGSD